MSDPATNYHYGDNPAFDRAQAEAMRPAEIPAFDPEKARNAYPPIPATEQYIDLDQAERDTARGAVLTGLFIVGGIAAIVAAGVLVWSLAK